MARENLNPFTIAQTYFNQAAKRLRLDSGMRAMQYECSCPPIKTARSTIPTAR